MASTSSLRDWIIDHDHKWLFVASYITLAVVLSIAISLFWLLAVVAVHLVLELVRQYCLHSTPRVVVLQALWEVKLDIALVVFALALSLYMEAVLGILGIRSAAQLGGGAAQGAARTGARFAVWQRVLRGTLLSVDDVVQVCRAILRGRARRTAEANTAPSRATAGADAIAEAQTEDEPGSGTVHSPRWGDWTGSWSIGDWLSVGLGVACLLLMLAAPFTVTSFNGMVETLLVELHPYPLNMAGE